ncbi:PilW family protein [Microbulbifer sp. JMSA004]|uniref:PilW family protein n=1 Tax=unclassified Microbulbifer TaxID=2619833 RepID=UPI0024AE44BB|nr:PilW family protein [Microbulbifer sp. VAAF005]WHI48802.1 PilW family protein [Microbulbifer sp. VAAF005]
MRAFSNQRGLSLIELMIGILLGSLLLLGVLQIFQSNNDTYRMQDGFSRVQESGRFAIDLLSKEIRLADYWGCTPDQDSIENRLDTTDAFLTSIGSGGIQGIDNASSQTIGSTNVLDGSDVLILGGVVNACGGSGRMLDPSGSDLIVSSNCPVEAGDIVLVSTCINGDIFTITDIDGDIGDGDRTLEHEDGNIDSDWVQNLSDTLQETYGADSAIFLPYQKTYFIAENTAGTNSLFVSDENDSVEELVPGIEDMQVSYGRDTTDSGIVDTWQSASSDADEMSEVIAIKLELLVASDSDASVNSQTISRLDGSETEYTDGRIRKLYVATVKVRNRGDM